MPSNLEAMAKQHVASVGHKLGLPANLTTIVFIEIKKGVTDLLLPQYIHTPIP